MAYKSWANLRGDRVSQAAVASTREGTARVTKSEATGDAIDATAFSPTRRDGPDVFQRLKISQKNTHDLV